MERGLLFTLVFFFMLVFRLNSLQFWNEDYGCGCIFCIRVKVHVTLAVGHANCIESKLSTYDKSKEEKLLQ